MNELDERYSTAEEAIIGAFFAMCKDKAFEKITVADIVNKSGVVRSTFYNHYENIPSLIEAVEDKTISDIFSIMEGFHAKDDSQLCHSFFQAICDYTKNNPFLTSLLHSPRGGSFLEKIILMFHKYVAKVSEDISIDIKNKQQYAFYIAAIIGTNLGVLHKWTAEDCSTSSEEVADILTTVFLKGVLPYINN